MKQLKLVLVTLLLFIIFLNDSNAQNTPVLTGSPSSNIEVGGLFTEFNIIAYSNIINNTDDTLEVKWQRTVNDLPEGWNTQVCDPFLCWAPFVSENPMPIKIAPNSAMLLNVYFSPNDIEGSGYAEVHVWSETDSSNVNITMTYSADAFSVGIDTKLVNTIKIYPNPAKEYLTLYGEIENNISFFEIYNLNGEKVSNYSTIPNSSLRSSIDISLLPSGVYYLKLWNNDFDFLKAFPFVKN